MSQKVDKIPAAKHPLAGAPAATFEKMLPATTQAKIGVPADNGDEPLPPLMPTLVTPDRSTSGLYRSLIMVGCEVRDADFLRLDVKPIEDCVHVRQDKTLADALYAIKRTRKVPVSCPLCRREIGGEDVRTVWRHNGCVPNRPFPVYLDHFRDLTHGALFEGSMRRADAVILGRVWRDKNPPFSARLDSLPDTKFHDETREALTKAEVHVGESFGIWWIESMV